MDTSVVSDRPVRILQLEDNSDDAELACIQLRRAHIAFDARRVDTRQAFLDALDDFRPDIVLADFQLPSFDGRSALDLVRSLRPDVPVIMVSGFLGDEAAVELLREGACDFVLKDRLARLGPAVERALREAKERALRQEAERRRQERDAWFRVIFEQAPIPTVIATSSGHIQHVNAAFTTMLGYVPDDVWGRSIDDVTVPADRALTHQATAEVGNGIRDKRQYEKHYLHRDGHAVPAFVTISSVEVGDARFVVGQILDLSSLKQAHAETALAHQRLRTATEGAGAGVWEIDLAAGAVRWDAALKLLHGLSADAADPTLDEWLSMVDPLDRERIAAAIAAAATNQPLERIDEQIRFRRPDGKQIWLHAFGRIERDVSGALHASGITLDLTARKRDEEALRESRQIIQGILDTIPVRVFWKDRNHVYMGCNATFAQDAGCARAEEIIGKNDFEMAWRAQAAAYRADDKAVMDSGQSKLFIEEPQTTASGSTVTLLTSKVPLRDGAGKVCGVLGTYMDITEHKQAQARVHESERRFSEIAESITEVFWSADAAAGQVRYASPAYEIVWGRTCKSLFDDPQSFVEGVHPEDRVRVRNVLSAQRPSGQLEIEYRVVRPDGSVRQMWDRSFAARDASGHVSRNVGVAVDITVRKRQEEMLERVTRALRASSLCNAALMHAGDEPDLYARMTRAIVDGAGYRLAWVGLVDRPSGVVQAGGAAGDETGYVASVTISLQEDSPCAQGPVGRCLRSGEVQTANDIATDSSMQPWHAAAARAGLRSCVAIPLLDNEGVFGSLNIYAAELEAFTDEAVGLLKETAAELSYGVVSQRLRTVNATNLERLEHSMEATVQALAGTVEMRDPYTAGHQRRVATLAVAIGRSLGLDHDQLRGIELAALIHDIGKLQVPSEILSKPGRISSLEYELIKSHAAAGAEILRGIEFPWPVREMVWQHHERLDGSGYPRGLKGNEILLEARIIAVADVVESMASHRPYRPARGVAIALQELERGSGTAYDPKVVEACRTILSDPSTADQIGLAAARSA